MRVALVTAPAAEAPILARRLVESRIAACVNVLPGVTSIYRWKGEVHEDPESLLIVKVSAERAEELVARVREWHSYDCPECVLLPVEGGNPDYLQWVRNPDGSEQQI